MKSKRSLMDLAGGHGTAGSITPHPPRRWASRVALPAAVLASVAGLLVYSARGSLGAADLVRVSPVVVKAVAGADPDDANLVGGEVVQAPGWIEAEPFAVSVTALVSGTIREVLVLEGDAVEAGQAVARLVDEDARLAVARAEAMLQQREAERAEVQAMAEAARRTWEHPIERERAKAVAEAALARARAELARWPAVVATEEATLDRLREERERVEAMFDKGATNEMEAIRLRHEMAAQEGVLEAAQAQRAVLEAQATQAEAELVAARRALELRIEERRRLDATEAALRRADAAVLDARAALKEARLRLERTVVTAPISGRVLARLKSPGDRVRVEGDDADGATIVRLYDPDRLQVRVDVPLADAASVGVGQRALVAVDVLPEREFEGEVTRVTHQADVQKNTLEVKVRILEPSPLLKPEMLARVKFLPGVHGGAAGEAPVDDATASAGGRERLFVPVSAVIEGGERGVGRVWVVASRRGQHGVLEARDVSIGGLREGSWIEIREGVQPGDLVVASPSGMLEPGEAVRFAVETTATPAHGG